MKLNLIAISYKNIGPFKDQLLSLFFENGNYLIKAPIGTGKSFLFFDGPTFALYKTSTRNILNIQSENGFLKLLFSVNGETFFIVRHLKRGKVKDSTSSHLYKCDVLEEDFFDKIGSGSLLREDIDIENLLKELGVRLEEIPYKNETDLQQELNVMLPPQEVFVSTIFLLQDSDNIFEMAPAERLEVLKNVFGLLGIDESKETIKEKRNTVRYQIKAYQDTSSYEEKLQNYLGKIIDGFEILLNNNISGHFVEGLKDKFDEISGFKEKLSINNFSVDDDFLAFKDGLEGHIKSLQVEYQKMRASVVACQDQKKNIEMQIKQVENDKVLNQKKLEAIIKQLDEINPENLKLLKDEKKGLLDKQENLEKAAENEIFQEFYDKYKEILSLQERTSYSLRLNEQFVQELISLGKTFKERNELLDKEMEFLKKKELLVQDNLKSQIHALQEKKKFYENQISVLEKKILDFNEMVSSESSFQCQKIEGQCPFVKLINKQHFEAREQEQKNLLNEKKDLEEQMKAELFDDKIQEYNEQLQSAKNINEEHKIQEEKIKNVELMEQIRGFLQSFDYKKLCDAARDYEKNEIVLKDLEKKIQYQEELQSQQNMLSQERVKVETTITQLGEQENGLVSQIQTIESQLSELLEKVDQEPRQEIEEVEKVLGNYVQTVSLLKALVEDYTKMQINLKELLEEERRLNVLYNILNKELLLFVLGSYLPVLTEIINSYLAMVVDYQISIKLKENSEKLELETKVVDEKGEREVKSLSGGQKTILKLVWMLAVSSYLKTEMLFLDETVNNLDVETVGRVAQMLDDFVKQRDMKFYTITHSTEIQSMKIWNGTVELRNKAL